LSEGTEEIKEKPVRMAGILGEIRNGNFPNTSYRYVHPLCGQAVEVGYWFLMAATMKNTVSRFVIPRISERARRFGAAYHFNFRGVSQARIQQEQMESRARFLLDFLFDPEG
jgi:hypothetical protein